MAPLSKLIFSKRKMPLLYKTKQNNNEKWRFDNSWGLTITWMIQDQWDNAEQKIILNNRSAPGLLFWNSSVHSFTRGQCNLFMTTEYILIKRQKKGQHPISGSLQFQKTNIFCSITFSTKNLMEHNEYHKNMAHTWTEQTE